MTPESDGSMKLGVNIDHVATLRQARGTVYPDPLEAARIVMRAGAEGLTVHLREDRRHILDADVRALRAEPGLFLNLEMAHIPEMVAIARSVRPDEVCLVPEKREERTTEGGLDVVGRRAELEPVVSALLGDGIRVSLFIEPSPEAVAGAAALGVDCVELHTGAYAEAGEESARQEIQRLIAAAKQAHGLGIQVNAGHGLNLDNLSGLRPVPWLDTLNIGHSIVARAVFVGLAEAVREMRCAMQDLHPEGPLSK